jgi:hypothetical protein
MHNIAERIIHTRTLPFMFSSFVFSLGIVSPLVYTFLLTDAVTTPTKRTPLPWRNFIHTLAVRIQGISCSGIVG